MPDQMQYNIMLEHFIIANTIINTCTIISDQVLLARPSMEVALTHAPLKVALTLQQHCVGFSVEKLTSVPFDVEPCYYDDET